ncbi:MAG: hypothetical protein NY202_03495 [Mollicutes bacterium UO1]
MASYWAWEKQRGKERVVGIREFMEKFPKEGQYSLKYGFIFSSQSEEKEISEDQEEENEEDEEEKKPENKVSAKQKERIEVVEQKPKIK